MTRLFTSLILAVIFSAKLFGQTPDDSTLVAAYNNALSDNWEHYKEYFGKETRAVYSDFLKAEHLSKSNKEHFKMLEKKDLGRRCRRIFISRKPKEVYFIRHKNLQEAKDTIDILISEQTFRCLGRKHIGISTACRGTMGYIPDGRLIFNPSNNLWEFISFTSLYDAAIVREQEWLKKMSKKR